MLHYRVPGSTRSGTVFNRTVAGLWLGRVPGFVFVSLLMVPLAACGDQPGKDSATKRKPAPHLVEVVTVRSQALSHATVRTGSLSARRSVRLFNQEEGRIEKVLAVEGDRVKANQVLVTLDQRLLKAELEKTVAQRKKAEADFRRVSQLFKRKVASDQALIEAETALSIAHAEESLIRTRLGYTEIRALFDGVVTERKLEPGDVAPRHTLLLTLIDPDSLYTTVSISELMLPWLKAGDPADVRIDALGDTVWKARVERIHPTVDPRTRQGVVEVALAPVPPGAAAGQLCRVTLRTPASVRRILPFAALRQDKESSFVFVVNKGEAIKRTVRTGLRFSDRVDVLDGVGDGDLVVVRGFLDLRPGKKVVVSKKDDREIAADSRPAGKGKKKEE